MGRGIKCKQNIFIIMAQIELKDGRHIMVYHSETRVVTFLTSSGVMIEAEVPRHWDYTRVFQFMDSLMKANKYII